MLSRIKIGLICFVCVSITIIALSGTSRESGTLNMPKDLKTVDILSKTLPEDATKKKTEVKINLKTVKIDGIDVFYREAAPPADVEPTGHTLLLLHGRSFKSETWEKLETLQIMAALGNRVVAIDLPGYGNTQTTFSGDKAAFLKSVMDELNLIKPVIVSPSMSGEYSVRFLGQYAKKISGFIPVAPVATDAVPKNILQTIETPTLIVYGSEDNTGLAETSLNNLKILPNSREMRIEKAGHPAYLNQPELWHQLLYNFLELVYKK